MQMKPDKQRTQSDVQPTRKERFIRALAEYLAGDQVEKSVGLKLGKKSSAEWAHLRGLTPLFGYQTVDEANEALLKFLQ